MSTNPEPSSKRIPRLSKTRTDRDWIMIVIGVCLVIFFLVGGYLNCFWVEKSTAPKLRGPVKDPARLGDSRLTPYEGAIALGWNRTPHVS